MITSFNFGESGKIFEDPSVFEGMKDGVEEFSGSGDDGFAGSSPGFDSLKEAMEVRTIALCNQCALHEGCTGEFVVALCDAP